jgi:hypothetical protein
MKKEQIENVKQKLSTVSDAKQLSETDQQLFNLLQKHFTSLRSKGVLTFRWYRCMYGLL